MAHFCFLATHNIRDVRGTAAENEWMERAIYLSHKFDISTPQNQMVDLEAFANPLFSDFSKVYHKMVEVKPITDSL